ncbi:hypothetical protein ACFZBU_14235 [Embleya sp. NPDC008237]|uniref:hypothetical protein n=1 Tax=unclassified Embleya TaxID=2699296 RepID=UPI0036E86C49
MHVMRAVQDAQSVVWHAMESEDVALCGVTLPPGRDVDGTRRRETFCVPCMSEVERTMRPVDSSDDRADEGTPV